MAETTPVLGDDWSSKTVVVTAGGAGIGYHFVCAFHALGCTVHTCDVAEDKVQAVTRDLPGVRAVKADVSIPEEVDAFIDGVVEESGRLDILINKRRYRRARRAGRGNRYRRLEPNLRDQRCRAILLHAPCRATDEAARRRRDHQHVLGRG